MCGSGRFRLLVMSLLVLLPLCLCGQTAERIAAVPQSAPGLPLDFLINSPNETSSQPVSREQVILHHSPVGHPAAWGFPEFARAAGMIFSGAVIGIERRPASRAQAIETVAITFHVENAIRGATPGENLTITQWIGLWFAGQRYRVGERVFLFLYPPSKLGLTSCVGWPVGRFTLDASGRVLLSAQHLSAFRADPLLGGRSRVRIRDFALAVRRASEEE